MKRKTRSKTIVVFIAITMIGFSPLFYVSFIKGIKMVYYHIDYKKNKILIDSVNIYETSGPEGGPGATTYDLFYNKNDLLLRFVDQRELVIGRMFGDTLRIPQLLNYMETHHDSIWVWYHPKAQAIYAKEEDIELDITPYKQAAFFNFLGLGLAIYGLFYLINQKRKLTKTKTNEKK